MQLKQFNFIATKVSSRKKCYYFWWSTRLLRSRNILVTLLPVHIFMSHMSLIIRVPPNVLMAVCQMLKLTTERLPWSCCMTMMRRWNKLVDWSSPPHSALISYTCAAKTSGIAESFGNPTMDQCDTLRWRHNYHADISNHQPHGCLLNRVFRRRSKKTSKLRVTGLCAGKSPGPLVSPHKGPVTRKLFPFDDVIMDWEALAGTFCRQVQSA